MEANHKKMEFEEIAEEPQLSINFYSNLNSIDINFLHLEEISIKRQKVLYNIEDE